jgi:hypothetical protein
MVVYFKKLSEISDKIGELVAFINNNQKKRVKNPLK